MKYSIVVPIYNVEKYLRETIESVLKQNFSDYELILVNDGSLDNSLNICKEYEKNNPNIVIVNKENGGLISAREAGIKASSGDYIISLDGDDYIASNCLSIIDSIIKKYEDIDMVFFTGYDDFDGKLVEYNSEYEGYFDQNGIKDTLLAHCVNGFKDCTKFRNGIVYKAVKRSIILNNLKYYDKKISMGEDLLISTACICDSKSIYVSNEKLYYYRQFDSQMTRKYKKKLFVNEDLLIRTLLKVAHDKDAPIDNQLYRHALEIAKSTVYNEIRFNESNEKINLALKEIYDTELYRLMSKEMNPKKWSKSERLFALLLRKKCNFLIKFLGKVNFKLRG